jgi:hypothetical protein
MTKNDRKRAAMKAQTKQDTRGLRAAMISLPRSCIMWDDSPLDSQEAELHNKIRTLFEEWYKKVRSKP